MLGPLSRQVGDFQTLQQGGLQRLVSQKTFSQKDTTGSTLNCLNVMENTSFAHFVCQKDCNPRNILRISTLKIAKIAYSFKVNIMQNTLNKCFQTYIYRN